MPTELGEAFLPTWRGKYPHMLTEDYPVWELFLSRNAHLFQRIYYDVRIGGVISDDPNVSQKDKDMFYQVTAKRIDALGELEKEIWIIEVAARPGLRAIGQLMTYYALWYKDPKINKPAFPMLVANAVDADLQEALTINGVLIRLVI